MRAKNQLKMTQIRKWAQFSSFLTRFDLTKTDISEKNWLYLYYCNSSRLYFLLKPFPIKNWVHTTQFNTICKFSDWLLNLSSIFAHCLGLKFRKNHRFLLTNSYPWCLNNSFYDLRQLSHVQAISLEGFFEFQMLIFCSKVGISLRYLVNLTFIVAIVTDNVSVANW